MATRFSVNFPRFSMKRKLDTCARPLSIAYTFLGEFSCSLIEYENRFMKKSMFVVSR